MKEKKIQDTKKHEVKKQENVSLESGETGSKQSTGAPECDCNRNTKEIYDVT